MSGKHASSSGSSDSTKSKLNPPKPPSSASQPPSKQRSPPSASQPPSKQRLPPSASQPPSKSQPPSSALQPPSQPRPSPSVLQPPSDPETAPPSGAHSNVVSSQLQAARSEAEVHDVLKGMSFGVFTAELRALVDGHVKQVPNAESALMWFYNAVMNSQKALDVSDEIASFRQEVVRNDVESTRTLWKLQQKVEDVARRVDHTDSEATSVADSASRVRRPLAMLVDNCAVYARNNKELLKGEIRREVARMGEGLWLELGTVVKGATQDAIEEVRANIARSELPRDPSPSYRPRETHGPGSDSEDDSDAEVRQRYGGTRRARERERRSTRSASGERQHSPPARRHTSPNSRYPVCAQVLKAQEAETKSARERESPRSEASRSRRRNRSRRAVRAQPDAPAGHRPLLVIRPNNFGHLAHDTIHMSRQQAFDHVVNHGRHYGNAVQQLREHYQPNRNGPHGDKPYGQAWWWRLSPQDLERHPYVQPRDGDLRYKRQRR